MADVFTLQGDKISCLRLYVSRDQLPEADS